MRSAALLNLVALRKSSVRKLTAGAVSAHARQCRTGTGVLARFLAVVGRDGVSQVLGEVQRVPDQR
ncbi:hypothetical protein [Georgenia daeguensis]|uniref:hypothetical protein n=1 Tax=Georgenia daeguensis TaxID=908355 RepID=UPI0031F12915